ncbi:aminotransferase class IV [Roseivivax sp. CAU 1761]
MIETLFWSPATGAVRGARHLARAERSCAALGFAFDRAAARTALFAPGADGPVRLRVTFGPAGEIESRAVAFAPDPEPPVQTLVWAAPRLASGDPWLAVKTTRRALYDRVAAALPDGAGEALFLNEAGEVCEGTRSNLFLERADGARVTPRRAAGLLPGILREELLASGAFSEAAVTPAEVQSARRIWIGNSLRGLQPAILAS